MKLIRKSKRQLGQGMTEYIIIVALIAIGAVGVFTAFGKEVQHEVAGIAQGLSGRDGTADVTAANGSADASRADANANQGMSDFNQKSFDAASQR